MPQFTWGDGGVNSETFTTSIRTAYTEVVHWKRNIFSVPSGSVGKAFVNEVAMLYHAYADSSAFEVIALSATTILPDTSFTETTCTSEIQGMRTYCLPREVAQMLGSR